NGISQVVQGVYPKQVLSFGVGELSVMKTVTQCGQMASSGWVGRFSDRYGNRPTLMFAQACVSLALVFFIAASDSGTKWLVAGAGNAWAGCPAPGGHSRTGGLDMARDHLRPARPAVRDCVVRRGRPGY